MLAYRLTYYEDWNFQQENLKIGNGNHMKTRLPLKVQSIRSRGQKERPYVYLSADLAEKTGLKQKDMVEWELIGLRKLRLVRIARKKRRGDPQTYPLKLQAIRSKGQKTRLYVFVPVPLAAAIRLRHGEAVRWEYDGSSLLMLRNAQTGDL